MGVLAPPHAFLIGLLIPAILLIPAPLSPQELQNPPKADPKPIASVALAREIRDAAPDPEACYRVRDLELIKEDIRLYFTDGYLVFGKEVRGHRLTAVYYAAEPGDDAEILLRPPNAGERSSLAARTGAPNLNEHFRSAVFLFSDGAGDDLLKRIKEQPVVKPAPDIGLVIAGRWSATVRNLSDSFLVRLVLDVLSNAGEARGFFYAAIAGSTVATFDVLYDPALRERILIGALSSETSSVLFEIWASFESRSQRRNRVPFVEELQLHNHRIKAKLDSSFMLTVTTEASLRPLQRLEGAIPFNIAPEMTVTSATLDGAPVEIFRRDAMRENLMRGTANQSFLVLLPKPLLPGETHEIVFQHAGKVVLAAGNDVYYVAARSDWYPTHGSSFSQFDLAFQIPKDLNIVATGELVEDRVEGEWRYSRRTTSEPVRFAAFNLGSYTRVSINRGGYQVDVYANRMVEPSLQSRRVPTVVLPPNTPRTPGRRPGDVISLPPPPPLDPAARLSLIAEDIAAALEWMSGLWGPPPLKHLTVSPIPGSFGQGFPGLIYLSTLSFLAPDSRPAAVRTQEQVRFYSELLSVHETAHQWWGNLVTSATYHDEWLQEALANYSSLMFLEKRKGAKAMELALQDSRERLMQPYGEFKTTESAGPIVWGSRLGNAGFGEPWRSITYEKGSWIMHMLRYRMGDARFGLMMRALVDRYRMKGVSTDDFQRLVAEFSPPGSSDPKLESFFDGWIYGTGIPDLVLTCSHKGKAPSVMLSCTLRQSGVPDDFSVDVPVEIRTAGAKPLVRWLRSSSEPVTFSERLKAAPQKVELGSILSKKGPVR